VRPRHGFLAIALPSAAAVTYGSEQERVSHLSELRQACEALHGPLVASYDSAALLHRLPRPSTRPAQLSLTRPGASPDRGGVLVLRGSGIPDEQRTHVDGFTVTTIERTAIDLARGLRLPEALIPLDAAARQLLRAATGATGNDLRRAALVPELRQVVRDTLARALLACFGWPGTVVVRDSIPLVDPAAESPLESRSRGWLLEDGISGLIAGHPIECAGTTYWADLCDPVRRVIFEADGWIKYGQSSDELRRAWDAERYRQSALEDDGWIVARWTSSDTRRTVLARARRALGRT
jgi:hypothetical protein